MASKQDWEYWHRLAKAMRSCLRCTLPHPGRSTKPMNAVSEMRQRMGGLRKVLTPQYRGDWGEAPPLHSGIQEAQGGAGSGSRS